jgi:hypothetical protein
VAFGFLEGSGVALPATTIDETSASSNGMELSDAEIDLILDPLDYDERIERQKGRDFYDEDQFRDLSLRLKGELKRRRDIRGLRKLRAARRESARFRA